MSQNNNFYVYVIFRLNGIPCYVGKGRGRRWQKHRLRSSNPHLLHIVKNANNKLPRIKIREDLTEAEAFKTEVALIAAIGREPYGPLVNLTDGGEGPAGRKMSEQHINRLRQINKGNTYNVGRVVSEETRAKMRAAKLGKKLPQAHRDNISKSNIGKHSSPEIGAAISAGKRGKKATEETRAILRAANRSRDPAVRALISERTRAAMTRPEVREKLKRT